LTSRSAWRRRILRWVALAVNSSARTRTETQAEQSTQLGRYATDWERRNPMRPRASLSSPALRPLSSVNTFRSTLPGRYGHGDGLVTKNLGKRNGALTPSGLPQMVTKVFMLVVNAQEKGR